MRYTPHPMTHRSLFGLRLIVPANIAKRCDVMPHNSFLEMLYALAPWHIRHSSAYASSWRANMTKWCKASYICYMPKAPWHIRHSSAYASSCRANVAKRCIAPITLSYELGYAIAPWHIHHSSAYASSWCANVVLVQANAFHIFKFITLM